MTQHEQDSESDGNHLEQARLLLERYDWQLVLPHELVENAALIQVQSITYARTLIGGYCTILHSAFMGNDGSLKQWRACDELGTFLTRIIARKYPDLPIDERHDVAQNTLERIWRARDSCREPVAFIAFAASHLLTSVHLTRRQLQRLGTPLPLNLDDNSLFDIPDRAFSPDASILHSDRQDDLVRFFALLRQKHPRALRQIEILELRCFEDLDYPAIAERLHISVGNAYTLNSRIIATIRADAELLEQAHEIGIQDLV